MVYPLASSAFTLVVVGEAFAELRSTFRELRRFRATAKFPLARLSAFGFGFVDDKIGAKRTVLISVVALGVAVTIAAVAPSKKWFWLSAVLFGLFSGPNQAASRSLMSRFVPDHQQAAFFGFFSFSGKATAFLGPFLFAWLTNLFQSESYHSERIGISVLILMFAVGGLILWTVDETEGIRAAREASAKAA